MTRKKRRNYSIGTPDFNCISKKIQECQLCILESSFYEKFLSSFQKSTEAVNIGNITHCICYGLGNFTSCLNSRYQLALLLLLKDHFQLNISIYDPVFLQIELDFLCKFNLSLIEENEEGLRKIDSPTFMYMPHCPTALTNNLLWSNWQPDLKNIVMLGNSFKLLSETLTERDLKSKYQCIHSILPFTREFQVENDFRYSDIFNNFSLHVFPSNVLNELPCSFWECIPKPIYDNSDLECISKKISVGYNNR